MSVVYDARCECGSELDVDCTLDEGQDLLLTVEKCPDCFKILESLGNEVQSLRKQVETQEERIEELESLCSLRSET